MNQPTSTMPAGGSPQHPVLTLREQLTQALGAAGQLRAILATVEDPGRRVGEPR
jgi:hypothetical protein